MIFFLFACCLLTPLLTTCIDNIPVTLYCYKQRIQLATSEKSEEEKKKRINNIYSSSIAWKDRSTIVIFIIIRIESSSCRRHTASEPLLWDLLLLARPWGVFCPAVLLFYCDVMWCDWLCSLMWYDVIYCAAELRLFSALMILLCSAMLAVLSCLVISYMYIYTYIYECAQLFSLLCSLLCCVETMSCTSLSCSHLSSPLLWLDFITSPLIMSVATNAIQCNDLFIHYGEWLLMNELWCIMMNYYSHHCTDALRTPPPLPPCPCALRQACLLAACLWPVPPLCCAPLPLRWWHMICVYMCI